ncbi:MAG: hypothetical protein MZV64_22815 [Ignavibacteriales bacterium]|nr:hypothetical protein [Ignavibacteriales bacterium]
MCFGAIHWARIGAGLLRHRASATRPGPGSMSSRISERPDEVARAGAGSLSSPGSCAPSVSSSSNPGSVLPARKTLLTRR